MARTTLSLIGLAVAALGADPLMCLTELELYAGVQVHDAHPAVDLDNRANVSATACAEWCCGRADCKAFYHTSSLRDSKHASHCEPGAPCCWIKPTFNATRIHDDADCHGEHVCLSGVRTDVRLGLEIRG